MEQKFWYGIWKMREWNGRFQEWNGRQSSILPYQFHTRFCALYLQKNTYRCPVVINILSQKYSTSISTRVFCRQIALLWLFILRKQCTYALHHCKYIAICSIDVIIDGFDRINLFFLFEIDNLPSPKFCFLTSSRKLVIAISFAFQLIFIFSFSFSAYNISF